jgi:hypothetical protein
MGETKLKCKIFKTFYNLAAMIAVVVIVNSLSMIPFINELATINSGSFIDILLNSIMGVVGTVVIIYFGVTFYINWYKFVNYKPEPKPMGRALVSNGSLTPKRCGLLNLFC